MTIDIASFVRLSLPNLRKYPELTAMCRRAATALEAQTFNNWVFTRYVRQQADGVALSAPRMRGNRVAVAVAMIDPADPDALQIGAAALHPRDRWNRQLGRVVAALRAVRVPLPLAGLWCVEKGLWDHRPVTPQQKLFEAQLKYPWTDMNSYFPAVAYGAVVDVARQAVRHLLLTDASKSIIVVGQGARMSRSAQYADNVCLAADLVDKACTLPMTVRLTDEERKALADENRKKQAQPA